MTASNSNPGFLYFFVKRVFDILLSGGVLLCLSPLLIPLAILLKLTGEGYIFYTQPRIGYGGNVFSLLKFATMLKDSPNLGTGDITVNNDPRVLPVGRFLRKTKINELPQLINILKGDMSIVGPRPLTPKNFEYYSDETKEEIKTLQPGLTGIGSIVFRDEESIFEKSEKDHQTCYKEEIAPYKGALEIWYKQNRSIWVDTLAIFVTAYVILFPDSGFYRKVFKDLPARKE